MSGFKGLDWLWGLVVSGGWVGAVTAIQSLPVFSQIVLAASGSGAIILGFAYRAGSKREKREEQQHREDEERRERERPRLVLEPDLRSGRIRAALIRVSNNYDRTLRNCTAVLVALEEERSAIREHPTILNSLLSWLPDEPHVDINPQEVVLLGIVADFDGQPTLYGYATRLSVKYPTVFTIQVSARDTPAVLRRYRFWCEFPRGGTAWHWEECEGARPRTTNPTREAMERVFEARQKAEREREQRERERGERSP